MDTIGAFEAKTHFSQLLAEVSKAAFKSSNLLFFLSTIPN